MDWLTENWVFSPIFAGMAWMMFGRRAKGGGCCGGATEEHDSRKSDFLQRSQAPLAGSTDAQSEASASSSASRCSRRARCGASSKNCVKAWNGLMLPTSSPPGRPMV